MDTSGLGLFVLEVPKGTIVFKGFDDEKIDFASKDPCWFSFDAKTSKKYGKVVKKFKLGKTVRVINITSILFKQHFADQVNILDMDVSEKQNVYATLGNMVLTMKRIYGKYLDGYVQPVEIPSCWHGSFPKELCIFDVSKTLLVPLDMKTGGMIIPTVHLTRKDPTHEEWQRSMCEILKKTGATKRQIAESVSYTHLTLPTKRIV